MMKSLFSLFAVVLATVLPLANAYADAAFTDEEIAASFGFQEVDEPPVPVKQTEPDVPRNLKREIATIQVGFLIDEEGKVTVPRVVKSTNDKLNEVAVACVSTWEFKPAKREGTPAKIRVIVPLRFR